MLAGPWAKPVYELPGESAVEPVDESPGELPADSPTDLRADPWGDSAADPPGALVRDGFSSVRHSALGSGPSTDRDPVECRAVCPEYETAVSSAGAGASHRQFRSDELSDGLRFGPRAVFGDARSSAAPE